MTTEEKILDLKARNERAFECGGEKAIEKQHFQGKLTARERITELLDKDSFHEIDRFVRHRCANFEMENKEIPADGVVTGYGTIDGRRVFLYAQDFTSSGGSLGEMHAAKICKVMDMAAAAGCPIIGINDSGGARIQEGVDSLSGYGQIFRRNCLNSGKIPQVSLIAGPCAGGAAYSPALTDVIIMVEGNGQLFVTGPAVIEAITGETTDAETLGGAYIHASESGVIQLLAKDDHEALDLASKFLSYLPSSCGEKAPRCEYTSTEELRPKLDQAIPDNGRFPYDMKEIIETIVDTGSFFELSPLFADNIITGFARLAGRSVGIVANQPLSMGGCLDINSADKAARFIDLCDTFNVPLINLVDVPGFMPGVEQEHCGIIRHGAKMLYAYAVAEVPKITVILRKAFGGSYMAMCSQDMGADMVFAWPTAEIAVMGADGAVNIIFRKEIAAAVDKEATHRKLSDAYEKKFANPYFAASRGYINAVIQPCETRREIISALDLLENKPHSERRGNIPM